VRRLNEKLARAIRRVKEHPEVAKEAYDLI
jgi:hypothetical protein